MSWWPAIAGTAQRPCTEADRRSRPERHSHIRLTDRHGELAEQLFAELEPNT